MPLRKIAVLSETSVKESGNWLRKYQVHLTTLASPLSTGRGAGGEGKQETFMKVGIGFYRSMLTRDNYRFARQAGATHVIAHLTDYFNTSTALPAEALGGGGWGMASKRVWTRDEMAAVKD